MIFYASFVREGIPLWKRFLLQPNGFPGRIDPVIKRKIIMRINFTMAFIVAVLMQVSAESIAQKITLAEQNVQLKNVFKKIRAQSGFDFLCTEEQLSMAKRVTIQVKDQPIEQVLAQLFKDQPLTYIIDEKTVVVKEKEMPVIVIAPMENNRRRLDGRITGKVIDDRGEPLAGANIKVVGGTQSAQSSVDGSYVIVTAPGTYTLEISFIGYQTQKITKIVVEDDRNTSLNIAMKPATGSMQEVVVTISYSKASVEGLYTRQKNNAGISDGISAEQIGRTPDKNIGESIKRISGLSSIDNKYVVVRGLSERYNQAVLNGQAMPSTELNRKQFSFDIIPTSMVDNITVSKTITPDKSAEFGGGLVEINTKDIPTENFLDLSAGISVNSLTAGKDMLSLERENSREYLGSYAKHRYLFGRKSWNSLTDIRAYQYQHASETILSNNWTPYWYAAEPSRNFQASLGRVLKAGNDGQNRFGFLASVTYRNTQSIQEIGTTRNEFGDGSFENGLKGYRYGFATSVGGMLGVGFTNKKHKLSWQNIFTRLLDEQMDYGTGRHTVMLENSRGLIEKVMQTSLWQSQLKGEHVLGTKGIKVNWMGSYALVKRLRPDNHILMWKGPLPEDITAPYNEFNVKNWYSYGGSASAPSALRLFSDANEKNLSWDASLLIPFNWSITKNSFKAGTAGWYKDRRFYVAMIGDQVGNSDVAPPLGQLFSPKYGGGASTVSFFGDDYNRTAPLYALYGMFDNKIASKLRLVWGLRAEYFNMDKANQAIDGIIAETTPGTSLDDFSALRNMEPNWKFFPSANLTYSITPAINVRAAYSKSIIRPDLRDLAWFREYDFELGGFYMADYLRPTTLKNYDLRVEWYPGAGEIVSLSAFYKDIQYPMEVYQNLNSYNLQNNYANKTKGIEVEARKSLSFLSIPILKNITLYGNFTAIDSRVTPMQVRITSDPNDMHKLVYQMIVGQEEKRPLMGQSNYLGNAGVYYDDKHLHITVNYNTTSNRLALYNVNMYGWQFDKPGQSLDAQVSYRLLRDRAEIKLSISNLLNESNIIYTNGGSTEEQEAALKGDYGHHNQYLLYDKNKDYLVQKLAPGRTMSLGINYSFR